MDPSRIWIHHHQQLLPCNIPPNATGKKINESAVSPTTVDQIGTRRNYARCFVSFMRLHMQAFRKPTKNAAGLACDNTGAIPNKIEMRGTIPER